MKKLFAIAAFAALFSVSACDVLADMISTVPTFSVDNVVYDGQQQRLVRAAMCAYEWSTNDPAECVITVDPKDSVATAAFRLTEAKSPYYKDVTIIATNPLHPEKVCQQETSIHAWTFDVFSQNGEVRSSLELGTTYIVNVMDLVTEKPVERVYRSIKLKQGYVLEDVNVEFFNGISSSAMDFGLSTISENTVFSFTVPEGYTDDSVNIKVTVGTKSTQQTYMLD